MIGRSTRGAILAGGKSRRFGAAKALAEWRGRPLIEWVIDAHRSAVQRFCIVADEPGPFAGYGAPIISDLYAGGGPAAGIHAALRWAAGEEAEGIWCTPCDAPLVDPTLAARLIQEADGADAVLPRSSGPLGYEPLFGWYSIRAIETFAASLQSGAVPMHEVVARLNRVVYLPPSEHAARHGDRSFTNINRPQDLIELERERTDGEGDEG